MYISNTDMILEGVISRAYDRVKHAAQDTVSKYGDPKNYDKTTQKQVKSEIIDKAKQSAKRDKMIDAQQKDRLRRAKESLGPDASNKDIRDEARKEFIKQKVTDRINKDKAKAVKESVMESIVLK